MVNTRFLGPCSWNRLSCSSWNRTINCRAFWRRSETEAGAVTMPVLEIKRVANVKTATVTAVILSSIIIQKKRRTYVVVNLLICTVDDIYAYERVT